MLEGTARFIVGDVLAVLKTLPEDSVDLVLTSPPFLALRSYLPKDHPDKHLEGGAQATPGEYLDWLIDVVEALDRVLAPHGSLVVEMGDTYAGSGGGGGDYLEGGRREGQAQFAGAAASTRESNAEYWRQKNGFKDNRGNPDGMRDTTFAGANTHTGGGSGWPLPKSMALVPELFRFALVYGVNPFTGRQTDRWRLRNVVRWCRPNPPVGELGDKFRPATTDLMVFCKSGKRFFDLDAVRGPAVEPGETRLETRFGDYLANAHPGETRDRDHIRTRKNPAGAPPLDFIVLPTHPYKGAHYATWPPELLPNFIKSMCPERVCTECGKPSERITDRTPEYAAARAAIGDFNSRAPGQGLSGSRSELVIAMAETSQARRTSPSAGPTAVTTGGAPAWC